MGDIIEMTTWPSYSNVFYKVSGSGITFEVKTAASAAIGLATKPGRSCDIWVIIGNNSTWIQKGFRPGKSTRSPNILNNDEYKRFWLSWSNGCIELGQAHVRTPIISESYRGDLYYVTFSSHGAHLNPVHWKIELPPTCITEKPITKSITNGKLEWVPTDNHSIPDGALIGGYEQETLYIMRAPHRGSLTPGKLVPSKGIGYIAWGYVAHEKNTFEVLCGFDCAWVPKYEDKIPIDAVEGGYIEHSREKLYIGRALHHGHLIPGKVAPSHKVCYIPYDGKEVALKEYDILVSHDRNPRCGNEYIHVESVIVSENDVDDDVEDISLDDLNNSNLSDI